VFRSGNGNDRLPSGSREALSRFSSDQLALLMKLNRVDSAHLPRLQSVVVPDRWDPDELLFSPMPPVVALVSHEKKAIVVDLAAQVFGAYELGEVALQLGRGLGAG
jgi:hypothetical protein